MFSGTGANSLNYAIGYATASNPLGPFTKYAGNPIVSRNDRAFGPGHGCVIKDGAGNLMVGLSPTKGRYKTLEPIHLHRSPLV